MKNLNHKHYIVTAGTKGLGRACVDEIVARGGKVATCARTQADLDELKELYGDSVLVQAVDLYDEAQIHNFLEASLKAFGSLDGLVINPPHSIKVPIDQMSLSDWQKSYDAIIRLMVQCANICVDSLKSSQGSVVVISSIAAIEPIAKMPASSVLRAGVDSWLKLMTQMYAPQGVRFNGVQPGFMNTAAVAKSLAKIAEMQGKEPEAFKKEFLQQVPLKRLGRPDEIAKATLFLLSDDASFISGTSLLVDGGLTKGV